MGDILWMKQEKQEMTSELVALLEQVFQRVGDNTLQRIRDLPGNKTF